MKDRLKIFLDTSALFTAVLSSTGGARLILKLGEANALQLWIGPWVLREAESIIERKSPKSKVLFALLLDRSNIHISEDAEEAAVKAALTILNYRPDAQVIAEAITVGADYFVSFDRKHLLENPQAGNLPFPMGTAGDFIAWYKVRLASRDQTFPL